MKLVELFEDREKGKSLKDIRPDLSYVIMYRAILQSSGNAFNRMDYVTLSLKFAKEHADHICAVEEETAHVIKKLVKATEIFEAYNPGEYFYDGPNVSGKVIYLAEPE